MSEFVIPRSSLQNEVASRLRDEIVQGRWRPGERLPERLLCERYGISRSPLREAYQSLIAEGLIEVVPNRGAIVTAPTPARTLQHFELLRALETLAVTLACRDASDERLGQIAAIDREMNDAIERRDLAEFIRLNNRVHRAIVLAAGNEPLAEAHQLSSRQIIRVQNLSGASAHVPAEAMHQHDAIVAALVDRDEPRAVALFLEHLDTAEDNLRRRLQEVGVQA